MHCGEKGLLGLPSPLRVFPACMRNWKEVDPAQPRRRSSQAPLAKVSLVVYVRLAAPQILGRLTLAGLTVDLCIEGDVPGVSGFLVAIPLDLPSVRSRACTRPAMSADLRRALALRLAGRSLRDAQHFDVTAVSGGDNRQVLSRRPPPKPVCSVRLGRPHAVALQAETSGRGRVKADASSRRCTAVPLYRDFARPCSRLGTLPLWPDATGALPSTSTRKYWRRSRRRRIPPCAVRCRSTRAWVRRRA
jgi:hypothetical protein